MPVRWRIRLILAFSLSQEVQSGATLGLPRRNPALFLTLWLACNRRTTVRFSLFFLTLGLHRSFSPSSRVQEGEEQVCRAKILAAKANFSLRKASLATAGPSCLQKLTRLPLLEDERREDFTSSISGWSLWGLRQKQSITVPHTATSSIWYS